MRLTKQVIVQRLQAQLGSLNIDAFEVTESRIERIDPAPATGGGHSAGKTGGDFRAF